MRSVRLLLAGAVVVSGCRGLIGIDEDVLTYVNIDSGSDGGVQNDATPAEEAATGTDAGTDTGTLSPGDAGACGVKVGGECLKCCKDTFGNQAPTLETVLRTEGCICGSGLCTAECGDTLCASAPPPAQTCGQCIDLAIKSGTRTPNCQTAMNKCGAQPASGCYDVALCINGCR